MKEKIAALTSELIKHDKLYFEKGRPIHLEVLPAYWGIETGRTAGHNNTIPMIWKYYPPTGVLKPDVTNNCSRGVLVNLEVTTRLLGY